MAVTELEAGRTAKPALIHAAIIAIMRAIEPIAKSQRNEQQGWNFRGIDQVYNAVHPHFAEHGVYSTSTILDMQHKEGKSDKGKPYLHAILRMRFTFWAGDGSSVSTEVVGEGMDFGGDKAPNKAMSVADKYAILQLLKIPTAMIDGDKPLHDNPAEDPLAPVAAPRGERASAQSSPTISASELSDFVAAWRETRQFETEEKAKTAFLEWVFVATGKSGLHKLPHWRRSDLTACRAALDQEKGVPDV